MGASNADFRVETEFIPGGSFHKVIAKNRVTGNQVGHLTVSNPDVATGSEVLNVQVSDEHRRKGIATKMWNHMYTEMLDRHGKPPEHDWKNMSEEGEAWAKSL